MIKVQCFSKIRYIAVMHFKSYHPVNGVMGLHSSRNWFVWKRIGVMLCKNRHKLTLPEDLQVFRRLLTATEDL